MPIKRDKKTERIEIAERGRVTRVVDGYAFVRFERRAACDKCGMCKIDADSVHVVARVKNTLDAHADDYVKVDMKRRPALLACLIYLVPLVLALTGYAIGFAFTPLAKVICATVGLVAGLAIAIPIDILVLRRKFEPKMTAFASPDPRDFSDAEFDDMTLEEVE